MDYEILEYLDVRKMMLSPLSQPVVRPLYKGGSVVLRGAHHHLLNMLLDALTSIGTTTGRYNQFFAKFPNIRTNRGHGARIF